ncbi:MAG: methyltransferase domain-containing protein [Paracoccaceae bacterium]|nr:methyltransferase domain-containing protein [Paracoccaceae bacterium]
MKVHSRDEAYTLVTSADHRDYYDNWAKTYDQDFAMETKYIYPQKICEILNERTMSVDMTLADIGCGTGLIGVELRDSKWIIDGFDISSGMLEEARKKRVYRDLIRLDLKNEKDYPRTRYSAVISSGTFTLGHLGPNVLKKILNLCAIQSLCVIGINLEHFDALRFQSTFTDLKSQKKIENFEIISVPIYQETEVAKTKKALANLCVFNYIGIT